MIAKSSLIDTGLLLSEAEFNTWAWADTCVSSVKPKRRPLTQDVAVWLDLRMFGIPVTFSVDVIINSNIQQSLFVPLSPTV
jgi:hypothetical protein